MSYDRVERTRRAAILIASLEETMAEQVLASLPPAEADKVRAELEQLDEIDPEEQQDVLNEFRRAGKTASSRHDAVEFTYSAPRLVSVAPEPVADAATAATSAADLEAEAALVAELLEREHPQTIAAALSRLPQDQAAATFAALPRSLQADVLERLAHLEISDEESLAGLETELKQRIDQQRARRQRMSASIALAQRMLEKTAPDQRETLLARIAPKPSRPAPLPGPANASPESVEARAPSRTYDQTWLPSAENDAEIAAAIRQAREMVDQPQPAWEAWIEDEPPRPRAAGERESPGVAYVEDQSAELERLSDAALFAALQMADEVTAQRALAASSDALLERVGRKLPRRQAARLRQLVRAVGPTRVADLREAQQRLLQLARTTVRRAAAS